ncbi:DNA polymerase III subunit tau [Polystyrenella longa]|uniref:DNA polymerase III subunit gamma/tau n=1 Tax=Polystyrenella longa TaxID=2528007 RepID=A0A518CI23_9PLAN|nr:DNA polymerase III subunit gamma/tau [Polystyrenella longa]QDU78824.1 DNA polymerase III subunit tau [Polystyrenella longa]
MTETTGNYTVLARRFRPQAFDEVIGQEHVAQALKNAIKAGRVAHAYLFTGARGVGKTSTARILAKTLNCPNSHEGNPCNKCEICLGISEGRDVDILEIDGASNRGIDDIRMLRANVNVKSMRTKYKIYIIDEVHMLTKEAFNALLKTLEEPPPGVKFIFCTTEPQKLPDTILSRCQRFDFSTIETDNISHRLKQIAKAEGFEVSDDAVSLVARRAAGSMRDSQSLFDQLLAFGGEHITAADVHRLLGTADDERLTTLADALIKRERREVLELLDSALSAGVQLSEFVDQLLNYMRDLMVLASHADAVSLLSVSSSYRSLLQKQAQQWGLRTVVAGLEILAETKSRMFRASHARSLVELALVRMTMLQDLQQMETIINLLQGGKVAPVTLGTGGASPSTEKKNDTADVVPANIAPPDTVPVEEALVEVLPTEEALAEAVSAEAVPNVVEAPPISEEEVRQESVSVPETPPVVEDQVPEIVQLEEQQLTAVQNVEEGPELSVVSQEEATETAVTREIETSAPFVADNLEPSQSSEPAPAAEPETVLEVTPGSEPDIFSQLVSAPEVKGLPQLKSLSGLAISGPNRLDLIYPAKYDFLRQSLSRQDSVVLIQETLSRITGQDIRIDFQPSQDTETSGDETAISKAPRPKAPALRPVAVDLSNIEDEFVKAAVQIFGSTSINVQKMLSDS